MLRSQVCHETSCTQLLRLLDDFLECEAKHWVDHFREVKIEDTALLKPTLGVCGTQSKCIGLLLTSIPIII
jgi:hypothetical protein